ncbi:hypothetical protein B7R21_17795 [Subtercola boreus]|uniref:DUF7882 domain-containing protein n=1 Tax=Subtercola boreus TaxID=120213 RepID=A0A3E0VAU6_9MICO|nr:ATP-dependent DNA ligase [Subtercola boreus]RFA06982.1 hypothetical protein B7R21_17795 [Subtercola boreus]
MGSIMYGSPAATLEFDDRTLAHLRAAIVQKLGRGEPFTFHFANQARNGSGHTVLWIHPAIALRFQFAGRTGPLNRAWVEALVETANNSSGLVLVDEPARVSG